MITHDLSSSEELAAKIAPRARFRRRSLLGSGGVRIGLGLVNFVHFRALFGVEQGFGRRGDATGFQEETGAGFLATHRIVGRALAARHQFFGRLSIFLDVIFGQVEIGWIVGIDEVLVIDGELTLQQHLGDLVPVDRVVILIFELLLIQWSFPDQQSSLQISLLFEIVGIRFRKSGTEALVERFRRRAGGG